MAGGGGPICMLPSSIEGRPRETNSGQRYLGTQLRGPQVFLQLEAYTSDR